MLADLVRRDLIEGWELPPSPGLDGGDIRLVLAELINPAYDLRNVAGLCKAAGLDRAKVEAALGRWLVVVEDRGVDDDLVRDVTEVLTSMCVRVYGRRSARRRAERAFMAAGEAA